MKLINYKYGYLFDCSIHGKIVVSQKEWKQIVKYIKNKTQYPDDLTRVIQTKKGDLYNLRVTATELLVKHFNIPNYKRGNYVFQVTN